MNWGVKIIIFTIIAQVMFFTGFSILPIEMRAEGWNISDITYDYATNDTFAIGLLGAVFKTQYNATINESWGEPRTEGFGGLLNIGNDTSISGIASDAINIFVGIVSMTWIKSLLGFFQDFLAAPYQMLHVIGMPQPWLGILSMAWSMAFFLSLIGLIWGRWQ